jgi:teichuronic acid biosynthesis glycosyltransferase TuaC
MNVLVISDLFPDPANPASGIFVERQVSHLKPYCNQTVVVPIRMIPPLHIWKQLLHRKFISSLNKWQANLRLIPRESKINGIRCYYIRYLSPPRRMLDGLWGFFAYCFLYRQLMALHKQLKFDLIHAHFATPSGTIALLARRWMAVPVALCVHGSELTYTVKQGPIGVSVVRWVFKNVDVICTNSSWTSAKVVKYGADPKKVKLVRLGGNFQYASHQMEAKRNLRSTTALLSVGDLIKSKGQSYVLEAVRILTVLGYGVDYLIVGDGPQRLNLQTQAERLGISGVVHFIGVKAHNEVVRYFEECDIFVLPSWIESFGVVYVEALGLGKPVIGCAGAGGPEDIKALGDCLELVTPQDVPSLVAAIRRLIDNPERRKRMGEIGREIVSKYYTWEQNAAATIEIYKEFIGQTELD